MPSFSSQHRDAETGDQAPPPDPAAAVVVMAKRPVEGRVKTRMVPPLTARQACDLHTAMLRCVLARLERFVPGRKVLALDAAGEERGEAGITGPVPGVDTSAWKLVGQGEGDLGQRLLHVWQGIGGGEVAFFGIDSPDVPKRVLAGLWAVLQYADAAAGPTHDGGYWTLLARRKAPKLLESIDWGTTGVYHQSRCAAASAGLTWGELPRWHDVDDAHDLELLRRRLTHDPREHGSDPALAELCRRLASPDLLFESESSAMPDSVSTASANTRPGDMAPGDMAPGDMAQDDVAPDDVVSGDAAPPPAAASTPVNEQAALAESRILIVDDNEQNVELMQAYLESLPCEVEVAFDGQAALDRVEDLDRQRPDLILLDVMMPKMSGFEVCRKLKDDPATRSIPIVMVTALHELGDIERGVESGTDDFVTKPVNRLELLTRCKSLLRMRQLKRELERTEAHLRDREDRRGEG